MANINRSRKTGNHSSTGACNRIDYDGARLSGVRRSGRRVIGQYIGMLLMLLASFPGLLLAADANFEHLLTGFPLTGEHQYLECSTCHANGVFEGTPRSCNGCHSEASNLASSGKPLSHIASRDDCTACHTTANWKLGTTVDHDAVIGNCSSCHNNSTAPGKPTGHVNSSEKCESCHRTSNWAAATFDHTGITTGCQSCHNGSKA
ncbi:MAG: hypothetical protein ABW146_06610, partial [Candidatus Sedimenticola sp. 6PFRAG7]